MPCRSARKPPCWPAGRRPRRSGREQARARFLGRDNARRAALASLLELRADLAAATEQPLTTWHRRAGGARRPGTVPGPAAQPAGAAGRRPRGQPGRGPRADRGRPARPGRRVAARPGPPGRVDRLDTRLLWRLARAELAAAAGRPAEASRQLLAGMAALHRHRAQFGCLDLQTGAAVHGQDLARAGLAAALARGAPDAVYRWSERARAQALLLPTLRPPDDPAAAAALEELRQARHALRARELAGRPAAACAPASRRCSAASASRPGRRRGGATSRPRRLPRSARSGTAWRRRARHLSAGRAPAAGTGRDRVTRSAADGGQSTPRPRRPCCGCGPTSTPRRAARCPAGWPPRWALRRGTMPPRSALRAQPAAARHRRPRPDRGADRHPDDGAVGGPARLCGTAGHRGAVGHQSGSPPGAGCGGPRARPGLASGRRLPRVLVAGPGNARGDAEIRAIAALRPGTRRCSPARTRHQPPPSPRSAGLASPTSPRTASIRPRTRCSPRLELAGGPLLGYDLQRAARAPLMVVLSSCDLGLTDVRPGDETFGMVTALLSAGSATVVASVARVADDTAMAAMVGYHRAIAAASAGGGPGRGPGRGKTSRLRVLRRRLTARRNPDRHQAWEPERGHPTPGAVSSPARWTCPLSRCTSATGKRFTPGRHARWVPGGSSTRTPHSLHPGYSRASCLIGAHGRHLGEGCGPPAGGAGWCPRSRWQATTRPVARVA